VLKHEKSFPRWVVAPGTRGGILSESAS
jgi:hypothetical protein